MQRRVDAIEMDQTDKMASDPEQLHDVVRKRLQWHSELFFDATVSGISIDEVTKTLSMIMNLEEPRFRANSLKTLVQCCPTNETIEAFHKDVAARQINPDIPPFILAVMTYDRYETITNYLGSLSKHLQVFPSPKIEVLVFDFSTTLETAENMRKIASQHRPSLNIRHIPAHSLMLFAITSAEIWGLSEAQRIHDLTRFVPHSPEWIARLRELGYCDFRNLCLIYLRQYVSGLDSRTVIGFNDDDTLFLNCVADMVTGELRMELIYDVFETVAGFMKAKSTCVLVGGNSLSPPNSAEMLYTTTLHDLANATSNGSSMDGRALRQSLLLETYNLHGKRGSPLRTSYPLQDSGKQATSFQTRSPLCQPVEGDLLDFADANCDAFLAGNPITRPIIAPPLGNKVMSDLSVNIPSSRGPHGTMGNMWTLSSIVADPRFIVPEFGHWRGEDIGLFAVLDAKVAPVYHVPLCLGHWRGGFRRNLEEENVFLCIPNSVCGYTMHRILEDANTLARSRVECDFFLEIDKICRTKIPAILQYRQGVQLDALRLCEGYVQQLLEEPNISKHPELKQTLHRFRKSIRGGTTTTNNISKAKFEAFVRNSVARLRQWYSAPDITVAKPISGVGSALVNGNFPSQLLEALREASHNQEEARGFLRGHFGVDWRSPRLALSCVRAGPALLIHIVAALCEHDRKCIQQQLEILAGNDHIGAWFALRGLCELAMVSSLGTQSSTTKKEVNLITVIIPVFRRSNSSLHVATRTVQNTLKLVLPHDSPFPPPYSVSVVIIDNGCGCDGEQPCIDGDVLLQESQTLGFTRITILRPPRNIGPVGGRNLGTAVALFEHQADAVLWIDDDPAEFSGLQSAVKALEDHGCVTGFIFLSNGSEKPFTFYAGKNSMADPFPMVPYDALAPQSKISRNVWAFYGGLCLIQRTTLLRCGLFDRRIFAHWEEFELSGRMMKVGEMILFLPSFTVTYHTANSGAALQSSTVVFEDMKNQMISLRVHEYLPSDLHGGRMTVRSVQETFSREAGKGDFTKPTSRLSEQRQGFKSGMECSLDISFPDLESEYTTKVDALLIRPIEKSLGESSVSVLVLGMPVHCEPMYSSLSLGGWMPGLTCGLGTTGTSLLGQSMYYLDNCTGDGRAALIGHINGSGIPGAFVQFHDVRVKGIGCTPCANVSDNSHNSGAFSVRNAYITAARYHHLVACGIPTGKVLQVWEILEETGIKSKLQLPYQMINSEQKCVISEIMPSNVRVATYEVHRMVTKNAKALGLLFQTLYKRLGCADDPNRLLPVLIHLFGHTAAAMQANFVAHQALTAGNVSDVGLPLDLNTCDILTLPCGDYGFEPYWKFYMQPTQFRELVISMHRGALFAYPEAYKLSEEQVVAMFNSRFNDSFVKTFSLNWLVEEKEQQYVSNLYHQLCITQFQYQRASTVVQEISKLPPEFMGSNWCRPLPASFLAYRDLVEGFTLPDRLGISSQSIDKLCSLGVSPLAHNFVRQKYNEILGTDVSDLMASTLTPPQRLVTDDAAQNFERLFDIQDLHLYDNIDGGRSQCANFQPFKWERFLSRYNAEQTTEFLVQEPATPEAVLVARMKEMIYGLFGMFRPLPTGRCEDLQLRWKYVDDEDSYVCLPSTDPKDCLERPLTVCLGKESDLVKQTARVIGAIINAASDVVLAWNDKIPTKQLQYTADIKDPYAAAILSTSRQNLKRWLGQDTCLDELHAIVARCIVLVDDKYRHCEDQLMETLSAFKLVDDKVALKWFRSFFQKNESHFMRFATEKSHGLNHTIKILHMLLELNMTEVGKRIFANQDDLTACVLAAITHDATQLWWDKNGEAHPLTGALSTEALCAETELNPHLAARTISCVLHHSSEDSQQLLKTYRKNLIAKGRFTSFASLPKYKYAVMVTEKYATVPDDYIEVVAFFSCADKLASLDIQRMVELPSPPRQVFTESLTTEARIESIFGPPVMHKALMYDRLNNVIYANTRKLSMVVKQLGSEYMVRESLRFVIKNAPEIICEQAGKQGYLVEPYQVQRVILETFRVFAERAPKDPRFAGISYDCWRESHL